MNEKQQATNMEVIRLLRQASKTFEERNRVYGANWRRVGPVMSALFDGLPVTLRTPEEFEMWHLFELIVVKVTRFATSGLRHKDSIHDIMVYAAMIEALLEEQK